jgi:hypothetical protein
MAENQEVESTSVETSAGIVVETSVPIPTVTSAKKPTATSKSTSVGYDVIFCSECGEMHAVEIFLEETDGIKKNYALCSIHNKNFPIEDSNFE